MVIWHSPGHTARSGFGSWQNEKKFGVGSSGHVVDAVIPAEIPARNHVEIGNRSADSSRGGRDVGLKIKEDGASMVGVG